MVCNHDHSLRKVKLDAAIGCFVNLAGDRVVAADANRGWPPDLGHCCYQEPKGLFCEGHVCVVKVAVDPVERSAEELGDVDAAD